MGELSRGLAGLRAADAIQPVDLWLQCDATTDRSLWNERLAHFFEYWLRIAPPGRLPGRQHFDPLDIPQLMPRIWMLDVVRGAPDLRFRYRLAGTKEVETLQREVTGHWLDEVHPRFRETPGGFNRFNEMVATGIPTYRKGFVILHHHEDHKIVENCMVPMARDGVTVDLIVACSVLYRLNGTEN